ncbi:aminotransferase class I/II-fold pyridoxal phosphate-dependent enzyme [Amycolatopsis sp. FU40]|uniref:aminotransferase class I/II-fold pyridoxal phosphate-dependent enzyme n=1 Tax=Amycolatopsis sp. FU40 TaxID=2914159 RepID=UPI001F0048F0|nr:aminotransferase class I/II-fold pyridoxal phosphate-dependent enzyme [Amycolatopsis sp. FU40]UKD51310.1 aminotransferase class I/II-fold pyridoxal phosphate-dependent enzyme [Amycolatopsis sp. FU40]
MSDPIDEAALSGGTAAEIALSVERAISAGRLAAGARLPTVRGLAARLAVSPATVNAAYRTLRNRGLVAAAGRAGTRVLERTAPANRALGAPVGPGVRDLADGNPDPALLPPLRPALAKLSGRQWLYGEAGALPALLDWFRLDFERDGLAAEHLAVAGGAMDAIERVLQAHLWPGDAVIVEDPAFSGVLDLVAALGLRPIAVPVDDDGLRADLLQRALEQRPAACVLTPRAQNPTGAALSPERAAELRKVFQRHENVLLIEDDHAAAIAGTEPETVAGKGEFRHWAVIRSVTKYLGPDLRLSVVSGDQFTVDRVLRRQQVGAGWASRLLQELAVTILLDPATPKLLTTARETYRERRRVLADALGRRGITLSGRSGFNGWIPTPAEGAVAQALLARGWAVRTGEAFRTNVPPGLRVTFANLSPAEAEDFAATLHSISQGDGRGYPA